MSPRCQVGDVVAGVSGCPGQRLVTDAESEITLRALRHGRRAVSPAADRDVPGTVSAAQDRLLHLISSTSALRVAYDLRN
jgi:hypothetical protein